MEIGNGVAHVRSIVTVVASAVLLVACGSSAMSLSEYSDEFNAVRATYEPRAEATWLEFLELSDPTLEDFETLAKGEAAIRVEIEESILALEPPDEIAELHDLLADWIGALREAASALAVRAGTVGSWDELLQSTEYLAYEATLIGGAEVCNEFQARLDATAARGTFADTPWIPGEMKDVADAVLGCDKIPEDLDSALGW